MKVWSSAVIVPDTVCVFQYGYRLPDLPEKELVYCSVYFKLVGERLFTYA